MDYSSDTPNMDTLDLSDHDSDDLFASPSHKKAPKPVAADPAGPIPTTTSSSSKARNGESRFDAEEVREVREAALRKELEGVRNINQVIEGVIESLDRAKGNMDTVSRTVTSASTLLNTWIRILSQTEHNQRLILNPSWQGATQDVLDIENESVLRQQAAERRELEEQQRRETAAARRAEEERRRAAEGTTGGRGTTRGTRGRGRGASRGVVSSGYGRVTSSSAGYVGVGGQTGTRGRGISGSSGRAGSGIGRGLGSTRGRARGSAR
ncbi:MAG: hypothetical protein M1819_003917 [Sarea resinae]|nr:MAG: hypothetical protein M1819_003917 [Sarea resinae]